MSTNLEARAWIEVRADALRNNFALIRETVGPDVRVLPMVKANAYGLGVAEVVSVLEPDAPWAYGVATVAEGVQIRELGVDRPIVVCSPVSDAELDSAGERRLQLSISSLDALTALAATAQRRDTKAFVHIEVDTGMGRSGFDWRTASEWLPAVVEGTREDVEWVACFTHLHSADESDASVREQWDRLSRVLGALDAPPADLLVHVLNSAGVFRTPEYAHAVVRPGIFLYGGGIGDAQPDPLAVVSVRARVVHVRDVVSGTTLGYGATYRADGPQRWATLAIGYGDGLPRSLGNRGTALVHGRFVQIIGRISMDVTVVDITRVPDVELGDVATLLGRDGGEEITVDALAHLAGTISYEVLTGLTRRLPRVWMDDGS